VARAVLFGDESCDEFSGGDDAGETSPTIAVSSWSVLAPSGIFHPNAPGNDASARAEEKMGPSATRHMELPAAIAGAGIDACSSATSTGEPRSGLPPRDARNRSTTRRDALDAPHRDGDITHPTERYATATGSAEWIDAAANSARRPRG